jgi:hypothetical protein
MKRAVSSWRAEPALTLNLDNVRRIIVDHLDDFLPFARLLLRL